MSNDIIKVFHLIHTEFQKLQTFCDEKNIFLSIIGNSYYTTSKLRMPNIYTLKVYEKDFNSIYNNFSLVLDEANLYLKNINDIKTSIELANNGDTSIEEYMFWEIEKDIKYRLLTKVNLLKYHRIKLLNE